MSAMWVSISPKRDAMPTESARGSTNGAGGWRLGAGGSALLRSPGARHEEENQSRAEV